jgi:putative phosphoesterase
MPPTSRIGLISDTHGLLRPAALAFLSGCSRIIHGGDIGGAAIIEALGRLAPVTAVRGNNDAESWADHLPEMGHLQEQDVRIVVIHDLSTLRIDPVVQGVRVVVSGHSHKPFLDERCGVLFVNPGSAGPRRFKLPIAVGELLVCGASARARIVELAA